MQSNSTPENMNFGGIDIGGTNCTSLTIDKNNKVVNHRQSNTNTESYEELLAQINDEIQWILETSATSIPAIGIGIPGIRQRSTGNYIATNLPIHGKQFVKDITELSACDIIVEKDCSCFALSEADLLSADEYYITLGLAIGTGVGGGLCINKQLYKTKGNASSEIGHIAMPCSYFRKYDLNIPKCKCGKHGCYEAFVSGEGIGKFIKCMSGKSITELEISNRLKSDYKNSKDITTHLKAWYELVCELLHLIHLTWDPDCIVVGGGVTDLREFDKNLNEALRQYYRELNLPTPSILHSTLGGLSTARGAALNAKNHISTTTG